VTEAKKTCLECQRTDQETPLVNLEYQGERIWICPQHLPLLIHNPGKLAGRLPGAENLKPADAAD
jgi:hypothetical protein